jgi:Zn-dependent protease/CBS domain-containing protein
MIMLMSKVGNGSVREDMKMKWSWKIAQVSGIPIYLHVTFVLLIVFIAVSTWLVDRSLPAVIEGVAFPLALFASVLLHELGHALTARKFDIRTRDITLLPIGGVARLERMPDKPVQELWVALAGPAVNVVIAAVLFLALLATGGLGNLTSFSLTGGSFLQRLMMVNISLVLFNLIPAFPMDGGRVARALLAMRMEYTRATQIAATLGQGIALLFGFIGLFSNPFLVFIALFVWIGAAQEASMVQMKSALGNIPVSRAMLTDFDTLSPTDPLSRAIQLLLSGSQHDFPVAVDGKVVGILTRDDLVRALAEHNENVFVSHVMRKDFKVIDSTQMLESITTQVQEPGHPVLPVVHNGTLVGLLNMENLGEFLMIQRAIRARQQTQAANPGW